MDDIIELHRISMGDIQLVILTGARISAAIQTALTYEIACIVLGYICKWYLSVHDHYTQPGEPGPLCRRSITVA